MSPHIVSIYPVIRERRALLDLILSYAIGVCLLILNLTTNFGERIHAFLVSHSDFPIATVIANSLFVWLAILLVVAFFRWRRATRRSLELEEVVSSISPDALLVVDRDRTVVMCNASIERLFGYPMREVVGKQTGLLYDDRRTSPEERPREIYEALEHDGFHVGTATGRHHDGHLIPLEIITGELTRRGGAVMLLRDIGDRMRADDERREMEARMRESQKLESLGMLAGGIAHDFNNLLMVILGNADLLTLKLGDNEEMTRHLNEISETARQAADLCKEMLAYSGRGSVAVEPVDLSIVVREMGNLLDITLSKKVKLVYDLATHLPLVEGDIAQLRQIVMNLITNAADAIGGVTGTVTVRTYARECDPAALAETYFDSGAEPGTYVCMSVADDGCGMDRETLGRLFEPFFTTKPSGRGLGLASVQGIIRGHGGALRVESDAGVGTTFEVMLPRCEGDRTPAVSTGTPAVRGGRGTGTVLAVDDENGVLFLLQEMLSVIGFDVVTARDGREAVEVFREQAEQITCVLLDMAMPRMDGEEAMVEIRKVRPDVTVIMSSGFPESDALAGLSNPPPDGYIQKPYQLDSLMDVVSATLKRHGSSGGAAPAEPAGEGARPS